MLCGFWAVGVCNCSWWWWFGTEVEGYCRVHAGGDENIISLQRGTAHQSCQNVPQTHTGSDQRPSTTTRCLQVHELFCVVAFQPRVKSKTCSTVELI